jgi:predicted nucleic acid-binding protein
VTAAAYLDASAFVKLIRAEAESAALQTWLAAHRERASSALLRTEAVRAVRYTGEAAIGRALELLDAVVLVPIDDSVLEAAALLDPAALRTLDAIHLATARYLGSDVDVLVTYDRRMIEAAGLLGLPVASPR